MCRALDEWMNECTEKGLQKGLQEGLQEGLQKGILEGEVKGTIKAFQKMGFNQSVITDDIMKEFSITREAAASYMEKYW